MGKDLGVTHRQTPFFHQPLVLVLAVHGACTIFHQPLVLMLEVNGAGKIFHQPLVLVLEVNGACAKPCEGLNRFHIRPAKMQNQIIPELFSYYPKKGAGTAGVPHLFSYSQVLRVVKHWTPQTGSGRKGLTKI